VRQPDALEAQVFPGPSEAPSRRVEGSPAISVVIPTFRRTGLLQRCLSALLAQHLAPNQYEVLVVDDGREAETRRVVETAAAATPVRLRYLEAGPAGGPASARNVGWRAAAADIIAFTDDDCIPSRDWLRAGLDAMRAGVEGACGQVIVPIPEQPTDYEMDVAGLEHAEFVTANCFYRRRALDAVGGFDPRFRLAWREDSDIFFGLLERRLPLAYAPAALVVHPVRQARWGESLRQQRKSAFNALLYRKHPELYRQRIQSRPPLRYYAVLLSLVAGLAGVALGSPRAALGGAGAWLALTIHFSAERLRHTSRAPAHVVEMLITSMLIPFLAIFWRLVGAARFRVLFL
jgi:glycosyltransferase involved in cell wall biosynthesis